MVCNHSMGLDYIIISGEWVHLIDFMGFVHAIDGGHKKNRLVSCYHGDHQFMQREFSAPVT